MIKMIEENDTTMTVSEYPARIEATSLALHVASKVLERRRDLSSLHASDMKLEIVNAKTEAGRPLYSNETARECAVADALARDEEYQHFTEECDEAERLKVELAAKLERLRAEYRFALIDHEADRLGRRAAA
jgi:hypothetical protein